MKRISCFSLRSFGYCIASIDVIFAIGSLSLCSYYLYNDYVEVSNWPQEEVKITNALNNFIATMVDYILLHNFSNAFYMILSVTFWIKSLINLVVAVILIDGIRKQRLICIAPWLINTIVSMTIEIAIFSFMEMKIDEYDASMERRIARCILFGVFIVLSSLFSFSIFALYKTLKVSLSENQMLQESIAEDSGNFQHVKV